MSAVQVAPAAYAPVLWPGFVSGWPQPRNVPNTWQTQTAGVNTYRRPRLLIADDDAQRAAQLRDALDRFNYDIDLAAPHEALHWLGQRPVIDLVLLAVDVPSVQALDQVRQLRAGSEAGLVLLSEPGGVADRVLGLELGADDVLERPFEPRELVARVQAILRRFRAPSPAAPAPAPASATSSLPISLASDGWQLHRDLRQLTSPEGRQVPLTATEYLLMLALLRQPGRVVARRELLRGLPAPSGGAGSARNINLQVSRLRQKLAERAGAGSLIRTVRGAGYVFEPEGI